MGLTCDDFICNNRVVIHGFGSLVVTMHSECFPIDNHDGLVLRALCFQSHHCFVFPLHLILQIQAHPSTLSRFGNCGEQPKHSADMGLLNRTTTYSKSLASPWSVRLTVTMTDCSNFNAWSLSLLSSLSRTSLTVPCVLPCFVAVVVLIGRMGAAMGPHMDTCWDPYANKNSHEALAGTSQLAKRSESLPCPFGLRRQS